MLSMADYKGSASAVFSQKDNQQPVMQTSSAVERQRLASSGKKEYKPVLQRERVPSYFYEGHQKYPVNTPKEFEGLSNMDNLQYDKLRSKRYSQSKPVDEVSSYDKLERHMLSSIRPPVKKQPPNANLLHVMQSNKQSLPGIQTTVTQGKPGLAAYNKSQNQTSETIVDGNSLKVGNIESLVLQPAMIEVLRSSKEKVEHTESDTEANMSEESSCECGALNADKGDGPSSGYYRHARNQTVNDRLRNDGKYQQNQSILQENASTVGIKGQVKRNDRLSFSRALSDDTSQAISEINGNDKCRKQSIGRPYSSPRSNQSNLQCNVRPCSVNRQESLISKKPDNKDMTMPFTVPNGKVDQKPNPSNRIKQVQYSESITSNDENVLDQTKQQLNQKLKVSNLESVIIQPGSPTLIRVHQNLNSTETSPQDSGEEQQNLSENEKECLDSELYDQIPAADNQLPKIPEYNAHEVQIKQKIPEYNAHETQIKPKVPEYKTHEPQKNFHGFKTGSNEKHPNMSVRKPNGERNNQKLVPNNPCHDNSQLYYNAPRYQTPTMYEGKYTEMQEFEPPLPKKANERLTQYNKKSNNRPNRAVNAIRHKVPHQILPAPSTPTPQPHQTMPSKRQSAPTYMPPQHYQSCISPPEYYQCQPPVPHQNQQNIRKYKTPRVQQYHSQPMHCLPARDGQFGEQMAVHQYQGAMPYQQYMYHSQHSAMGVQQYPEQYQVHNSQQCQPDVNQYQRLPQYEQPIATINYQDYEDSIGDGQCCENYTNQQYVGDHVHTQYDYYNNNPNYNNNSNYYSQGHHQNAYCGVDYYDNSVYE